MRYLIIALFLASSQALACLESPLPTSPTGPTWSTSYDRTISGIVFYSADVTLWRNQCPDGENILLITIEPTFDTPFVCSIDFDVIQDDTQFTNVQLSRDLNNPVESFVGFCGDLLITTTFAVTQNDSSPKWNTDEEFKLFWNADPLIEVGPQGSAGDSGSDDSLRLEGALSGSWFDPDRDGEGLVLEFSQNPDGRVAVLYWFTHREGRPYWLLSAAPYESGQREITFNLLEFAGTGFGKDFDSDEIETSDFGAISLEFDSCSTGFATWETLEGETGEFNLSRITTGLDGAACN